MEQLFLGVLIGVFGGVIFDLKRWLESDQQGFAWKKFLRAAFLGGLASGLSTAFYGTDYLKAFAIGMSSDAFLAEFLPMFLQWAQEKAKSSS